MLWYNLSRLAEIVFSGSELKEDVMVELEKLPNLRVLVLEDNAFMGPEMSMGNVGFYKLRRLQLSNLSVLEKLTENEALPKLYILEEENCAALNVREMPPRIERWCCHHRANPQ